MQTFFWENVLQSKIYSNLNSLHKNTVSPSSLLNYTEGTFLLAEKIDTKKSCPFNHNLPLSFGNKTVYNEVLVLHTVRKYVISIAPLLVVLSKNENIILYRPSITFSL